MGTPAAAHDPIPPSERGDTEDHTVPGELIELFQALEALAAGIPAGGLG